MRKFLILLLCFACISALAQTSDHTLFPGSHMTSSVDSTIVSKASTGAFCKGVGAAVDTIDIGDARFKIVLNDDGTWKYLRDLTQLSEEDLFKDHWEVNVPNPYTGVELETLPYRNTIILQDSVSRFTIPHCSGRITSKFGWRWRRRHQGVDIPLHVGDSVVAAFDGRVRVSMTCGGYGKLVVIRHPNGLETYYGHLSDRKVEVGQWVHSGDLIGLGGNTGRSTGPHLHFETRYRGYAFDPEWIADYKTGKLRRNVFVLKRSYFNISSRYVPTSDDEEYDINVADLAEADRVANEQAAAEQARKEAEKKAEKWHTVRNGESLSHIATKYHTSVSKIRKLNPKVNPDKIRVGQKIRVQ